MVYRLDRNGDKIKDENGVFDKQIDCKATQAAGGCPLFNDETRPETGAVYGMFSTDCWYRGKYGNYLLSIANIDEFSYSFFGDNEDGTEKSADSCDELADAIGEALTELNGKLIVDGEDITEQLRYAEWYLRWASEECDGLSAWY